MRDARQTLKIGAVSSLAVTAMAVICGRAEGQSGWRPINAISHIAWGRKAAQKNLLTAQYTGMGLLLNGVACGFWAWLYRHCVGQVQEEMMIQIGLTTYPVFFL
jgi:hypothetical protein